MSRSTSTASARLPHTSACRPTPWACGPTSSALFDKGPVADALGVPAYWRVLAGIAVGVRGNPAEVPQRDQEREHRLRARRPLAEIAYGDSWGVPWDGVLGEEPPATLAQ